jgi:hypothetical protein
MDYQLENQNLSLNEKNKKLFSDIAQVTCKLEDVEGAIDTFKVYSDFMQEKEGLIQITDQLIEFGLIKCGANNLEISLNKNLIKDITEAINYKNRVIMIVNIL